MWGWLRSLLALDAPGPLETAELLAELQYTDDVEGALYHDLKTGSGNPQESVDAILAVRRQRAGIMRELGWHKSAAKLDADTEWRERLPKIPWGTPLDENGGNRGVAP